MRQIISAGILTLMVSIAISLTGCDATSPDIDRGLAGATQQWAVFDEAPSGRANQGVIVNGEFIGTDEIHFARGANVDNTHHEQYWASGGTPPDPAPSPQEDDDVYRHSTWGAFGTDRAAHNGDYQLPGDKAQWPDFTGDLAFVRMEADATDLYVHVRFVSFPNATAQIATITFKTAGNVVAVNDWPQNAGIQSDFSTALTLHGTGALLTEAGGSTIELDTLGGATRITDHAFEARIPLASLPSGPWSVGVGTGLADPADTTQYWAVLGNPRTTTTPGTDTGPNDGNPLGSNVWDLAFTPHDPRFHDDHIQGDLLRDLDVSSAVIQIDPATLQARGNQPAPIIYGRIAHTYQSAFHFGDGITRGASTSPPDTSAIFPTPGTPPAPNGTTATAQPRDAAVNYEYTGDVQPYFAYIPNAYDGSTPRPLVLYFHGLNNYIWEPFGLTLGIEDKLEDENYLFASTLGRGDISYTDRGELDPLEIIEHMAARYNIDRSRIYILGHSHGGGGVMNVSRRNPDVFAAVASAQILNTSELPENYRYINTMHIAGVADPIDNGNGAQSRYNGLRALGYDTQLILYQSKTHENSSIYDALNRIFDMFARSQQPINPAEVIFTRAGGDFNEALGLLHDGAYWVSDMVAGDASQNMSIMAISHAIPHRPLDPANASETTENIAVPTQCDNDSHISGRCSATISINTPTELAETTAENRASITLNNINALTLDTARMELNFTTSLEITLDLDQTTTFTLTNTDVDILNWQTFDENGDLLNMGSSQANAGEHQISIAANTATIQFQP